MKIKADKNIFLYITIINALNSLDNFIKKRVERTEDFKETEILNGNISLEKLRNTGAASGLLKERPKLLKAISSAMLALAMIRMAYLCRKEGNVAQKAGMSMLIGGALSNISDRFDKGYVTDYFRFKKAPGKLGKLVFNISDMNIIVGSIITTFGSLFENE